LLTKGRGRILGAVALAGFGVLTFFALGMHRGLLLSSDVKSSTWPWAPLFPARHIQTPALSDPVWQFVPWLRLARREIAAGHVPLWNPHQDGGVPLLGNAQSALGSPLNGPNLAAGVEGGWNLSLLARLLLAAAGAFALLRDLGRSRLAAGLGAVVFALSGAFIAWLEHPQTLSVAPAPLLFLFARRAARQPRPGSVAGVALATYLVLSGGHPEMQLLVAILAAAVAWVSRRDVRALWGPMAGAALGAGLAAPFLLPFAEYFGLSAARLGEARRPFVLGSRDLLRFLQPRLAGSNVIEAAATVSIVLLLLLPLGIVSCRRDRETRFWALASAAMLLVIYDNPLCRALAAWTPVYWTRSLLLLPLALAVVGTAGLDALRGLLARFGRALPVAAGCSAVAVCLAELLSAAQGVHGVNPAARLAPATPLLDRLAADRDVFRVLPLHTFLSPNSATDYGLDDVRGYDALSPAGWRRNRARMGKFFDAPTQKDVLEPWDLEQGGAALDDWNVKYLLQPPQFSFGTETLNARKGLDLEEVYSGPDGRIFRNRRAKPRVRFGGPGAVAVLERRPGRWRIEVRAEAAGSLLVADPFFPGWTARVDGVPAPLAARPGEPMAVTVTAGRHGVELAYRPGSFGLGVALSLGSALAIAALLLRARRGRPGALPAGRV